MKWHNLGRAKQLNAYDGLKWGNGSPTDIDALIEWKDKAYVLVELKAGHTPVPYGQELALKRMADDFKKAGKEAIVIVAEHYEPPTEDIVVAKAKVRKVYFDGNWYNCELKEDVKHRIDGFIEYVNEVA